jgi:hypothetical protein
MPVSGMTSRSTLLHRFNNALKSPQWKRVILRADKKTTLQVERYNMLAETKTTMQYIGKDVKETGHATFVPSPLLLLMAMDNGWKILQAEAMVARDQSGPTYRVTMRRLADGQTQMVNVPKIPLIQKILEQSGAAIIQKQ